LDSKGVTVGRRQRELPHSSIYNQDAETFWRQWVHTLEGWVGSDSLELVPLLNVIAQMRENCGDDAEAEMIYLRVIRILQGTHKDTHSQKLKIWSLINLAKVCRRRDEGEADRLTGEAFALAKETSLFEFWSDH